MKKIFLSMLIAGLFIYAPVKAQNHQAKISLGAEIGLPSGNFSSTSNIGLGGSFKADFPVSGKFGLSLNAGIINFFGKNNFLIKTPDQTYIPLKGGLKYFLSDSFYAEGQFGASLPMNKSNSVLFAWSPGVGNSFKLSNGHPLDFGIRYEGWTGSASNNGITINKNTRGFVGIRVAYGLFL